MTHSSGFFSSLPLIALFTLAGLQTARATTHAVTVGGPAGLKFDPPNIEGAMPGDSIVFTFKQKNHTATQSTLASPCVAMDGGFDSGFKPVSDSMTDDFPTYNVDVKDDKPIWVYCRQGNHCQQGMVFAVNGGDKLEQFQNAATGGSSNSSSSASATMTSTPEPSVVTVTATVTVGQDVWTTTYGSWPGSPEPTINKVMDHKVTVGADSKLVFNPSNITAQPGDTITFEFHAKNHTVTQSTFGAPCVMSGFDSGYKPVDVSETSNFPTWQITINDTKPVWAYCMQGNHCGQGMVFAVNAIESGPNNFAAFLDKAKQLNGTGTSPSASPSSSETSTPDGAAGNLTPFLSGAVFMAGSVIFSLF